MSRRVLAVGGLVGPAAFVTAWSVLGASASGYSPTHESISRLAAMDAPTRAAMTAGFLVFAAGATLYALALRQGLPGPAWKLALATAVATGAVAAVPLGTAASDKAHVAFAALAYGALAATPLAAARPLARQGRPRWAAMSAVCALAGAALLVASVSTELTGLFQRAGLGLLDGWIAASSMALIRTRDGKL